MNTTKLSRVLRGVTKLAGIAAAAFALPATAQEFHTCACLANKVSFPVQYQYSWGTEAWKSLTVEPNQRNWICWTRQQRREDVPGLRVRLDVDLSDHRALTTYDLNVTRSREKSCDTIRPEATYDVTYRPNTRRSFIQVTRAAPEVVSPPVQPPPMARVGQPYGCACLHNQLGQPVRYRYRWGQDDWKPVSLPPNYQQSLCWTYAPGSTTSPQLLFQLDVNLTGRNDWVTYNVDRMQSPTQQCPDVPSRGHYDIGYRPNNRALIQLTRRP